MIGLCTVRVNGLSQLSTTGTAEVWSMWIRRFALFRDIKAIFSILLVGAAALAGNVGPVLTPAASSHNALAAIVAIEYSQPVDPGSVNADTFVINGTAGGRSADPAQDHENTGQRNQIDHQASRKIVDVHASKA